MREQTINKLKLTLNPLPADHNNSRFYSVILAELITVIGNEMTV